MTEIVSYKSPCCQAPVEISALLTNPPKKQAVCTSCGAKYQQSPTRVEKPLPEDFDYVEGTGKQFLQE